MGGTTASDQSRDAAQRPTARERHRQRLAEYERDWQERQRQAYENADQLIRNAQSLRRDSHAALADVACRIAALLEVARCDILLLDGTTRAIRYRMSANLTRRLGEHAVSNPSVIVQAVPCHPKRSPVELLRSDGPPNRFYAFINTDDHLGPIGILGVQSPGEASLSAENRTLLDAVAQRLGVALAKGEFRGWRSANADARRVL